MIPNAWAGSDFGADVVALRDTVRGFAQDKIAPRKVKPDAPDSPLDQDALGLKISDDGQCGRSCRCDFHAARATSEVVFGFSNLSPPS